MEIRIVAYDPCEPQTIYLFSPKAIVPPRFRVKYLVNDIPWLPTFSDIREILWRQKIIKWMQLRFAVYIDETKKRYVYGLVNDERVRGRINSRLGGTVH